MAENIKLLLQLPPFISYRIRSWSPTSGRQ